MVRAPIPTFTYTKLLNARTGEEDLGRIDYVNPRDLSVEAEEEVLARLTASAADFDAILISDQAETERGGVVTARVRQAASRIAQDRLVWVDSRLRAELFRGVLVKPNEREALEACARLGVKTFRELRDTIAHARMLVTHGARGVLVLDGDRESWVKTRPVENPVDICGAGDSFSAGAVLALACGASLEEAARFGNAVAAVTIMKKGTGTASPPEVLRAEEEIRP
jgi:sugar/nucleoside kinase (ribokinase family)